MANGICLAPLQRILTLVGSWGVGVIVWEGGRGREAEKALGGHGVLGDCQMLRRSPLAFCIFVATYATEEFRFLNSDLS